MLKPLRSLSLIVMAAALTLSAADPLVGTWKLNTAKSKYSPGPGPKSATVTYTEDAGWIVAKAEGVGPDGKSTATNNRYKRDGKEYPFVVAGGATGTIVSKTTGPNTFDATVKNGAVTTTVHTVVSKDGKVFTRTSKGTNADGKPTTSTVVYEKQ